MGYIYVAVNENGEVQRVSCYKGKMSYFEDMVFLQKEVEKHNAISSNKWKIQKCRIVRV